MSTQYRILQQQQYIAALNPRDSVFIEQRYSETAAINDPADSEARRGHDAVVAMYFHAAVPAELAAIAPFEFDADVRNCSLRAFGARKT